MATRKTTPRTAAGRAPRATVGQEPAGDAPTAQPAEARRPSMNKVTINHVSRIEGHAKITIKLDDAGQVTDTQFHVTQVRGFEKFIEGRPYYEMPSITARICGICPVSHLLASSKACDEIS
jgi:NADH:ubiquinone oxidoreductase subunit D